MHTFLVLVALAALAPPATAEVMDKELSVGQVWLVLSCALGVCLVAGSLWRWLLVPSLLVGVIGGLGFTWTELYAPGVGASIRREAGPWYGVHVHSALSLLIGAHVAAWFLSSRRSVVARLCARFRRRPPSRWATLIFAIAVAWIIGLGTRIGFEGTAASIWFSPPVAVAVGFLSWALFWDLGEPGPTAADTEPLARGSADVTDKRS